MSVTFQKGAMAITLPGPVPGAEAREARRQAAGRTADGTAYVYDKGAPRHVVALRFESLTDAQRADLVGFFHDAVEGMRHAFTYTDSRGAPFTARLAAPDVSLTKVAQNVWDATVTLELAAPAG